LATDLTDLFDLFGMLSRWEARCAVQMLCIGRVRSVATSRRCIWSGMITFSGVYTSFSAPFLHCWNYQATHGLCIWLSPA